MPDDLPDGLDDYTLDDLVQLRDRAHARAQRFGTLADRLDEVIAEHEDRQAQQEAQRRRGAFRIITGGALLTLLVWAGRKLAVIGQIPPAAAGAALGTAALAGGAVLAVSQLATGPAGPTGPPHRTLPRPPAVTGRPPGRAVPAPSRPPASPPPPSPSPSTPPGGEGAAASPPAAPGPTSPSATAGTSAPAAGSPAPPPASSEAGDEDGGDTGEPSTTAAPSAPPPSTGDRCVLGVEVEPLLGVCVLPTAGQ